MLLELSLVFGPTFWSFLHVGATAALSRNLYQSQEVRVSMLKAGIHQHSIHLCQQCTAIDQYWLPTSLALDCLDVDRITWNGEYGELWADDRFHEPSWSRFGSVGTCTLYFRVAAVKDLGHLCERTTHRLLVSIFSCPWEKDTNKNGYPDSRNAITPVKTNVFLYVDEYRECEYASQRHSNPPIVEEWTFHGPLFFISFIKLISSKRWYAGLDPTNSQRHHIEGKVEKTQLGRWMHSCSSSMSNMEEVWVLLLLLIVSTKPSPATMSSIGKVISLKLVDWTSQTQYIVRWEESKVSYGLLCTCTLSSAKFETYGSNSGVPNHCI